MKKILVIGSLVEDLISVGNRLPGSGESVFAKSFSKAAGGKGANQAAAIAKLGKEVTFIGKTGDDIFSRELLTSLRNTGIDTTKVLREDNSFSGISAISIEAKESGNENRILMYPGANNKLTIDDVKNVENIIKEYDCLVLQFEIPMEVNEYLADLAHKNGVFVVVNPAPFKKMSSSFLKNIDLLIPNEHEAYDLSGVHISNDEKLDEKEVIAAGKKILSMGVKNVIITLGKSGSYLISDKECFHTEAIKDIVSIDPTAAGDSYLGSLVASLFNGFDIKEAMRVASYVSAIVVTKMGAIPSLPNVQETYDLMMLHNDPLAKKFKKIFGINPTLEERLLFFEESAMNETKASFKNVDKNELFKAMNLILHSEDNGGRLHITGIGKPSHVAEYMASLLSSTGTPTYYLHGTECVHGSAGQLIPGDVVIAISNSGETLELKATLKAIKANGCKIIGVSGNKDSYLAKNSDVFLLAHVDEEGGPLNKAPRTSILSEIIVLQMLSVLLQSYKNISKQQYVMWHPGGKLGGGY